MCRPDDNSINIINADHVYIYACWCVSRGGQKERRGVREHANINLCTNRMDRGRCRERELGIERQKERKKIH